MGMEPPSRNSRPPDTVYHGTSEDFDRIVRSIVENERAPKSLRKLYPALFATDDATAIITSTVLNAFKGIESHHEDPEITPDPSVRFRQG